MSIAIFAQSASEKVCPFANNPLLLQEYKAGMKFYFPPTPSLVAIDPACPKFIEKNIAAGDKDYREGIRYHDLSGKTLEIVYSNSFELKNYPGGNYFLYEIQLHNINAKDTFLFETIVEKSVLTSTGEPDLRTDNYLIIGAICLDEIEYAKKNLTGNYFALFPILGKRFQPVKVTLVEPGTWETPIRIHYNAPGVADAFIDVNIVGTNVINSYRKPFHFSRYFSCENPQGSIASDRWNLIQKGKPEIGMTVDEIILTLGKPVKTTETVNATETKIEYVYSLYTLEFTNGILSSIRKTSS